MIKYITAGKSQQAFLNIFIGVVQERQILVPKSGQLGWRGGGKQDISKVEAKEIIKNLVDPSKENSVKHGQFIRLQSV